ncbi:lysM domain receptor-like kinase 4 [Lycium ferocissimum]|uniref:lysM domain receptor-like kinase 4 n=1 Tax=Lycium ferocissimum TaxID=112874 RepID=UPI002814B020|nr:lysM domain receptor-like kinase 4 [Lycium ferocissimum]
MIFQWLLVLIWIFIGSSYGQQFYDPTSCFSSITSPGTRYTCSSSPKNSCQTFLVYRANQDYTTISDVSYLFGILDPDELLNMNNVTSSSQILEIGREVIVPIQCSCFGEFFQANVSYIALTNTKFDDVACGVFEGLVKSVTLYEQNKKIKFSDEIKGGTELLVPLKCACPDKFFGPGLKYLVTYPFITGDNTGKVSEKFSIPVEDIWGANNLSFDPPVFSNTTILVPLRGEPSINFSNIHDSEPPSPGFLPTQPVKKSSKNPKIKKLYIAGSVIGFFLVAATLVACGLYVRALKKFKAERTIHKRSFNSGSLTPRSSPPISGPTPTRSSTNSCFSPDLLAGIKYTLGEYNIDELTNATGNFSEETKISDNVYKGCVDNNAEVLIKRIRFEDTRQVIDVHSRINHVNIVKLQGVCYGEDDITGSYLVFEYPSNGTLRDCLSNSSISSLKWHKRTQIAFDIATGLHYLHFCTIPPYTHMNINSKNVFLTPNWRAKLAVFGAKASIGATREVGSIGSLGGWIAPEHLVHGSVSEKVDIFAFGVVLLELISGKEDVDGNFLRDSITFLGGGANEGGCFEQLKNFIDPCLMEDYPLAEALCLAVLAKACIEDDPLHRPSTDDLIKVLARMV